MTLHVSHIRSLYEFLVFYVSTWHHGHEASSLLCSREKNLQESAIHAVDKWTNSVELGFSNVQRNNRKSFIGDIVGERYKHARDFIFMILYFQENKTRRSRKVEKIFFYIK